PRPTKPRVANAKWQAKGAKAFTAGVPGTIYLPASLILSPTSFTLRPRSRAASLERLAAFSVASLARLLTFSAASFARSFTSSILSLILSLVTAIGPLLPEFEAWVHQPNLSIASRVPAARFAPRWHSICTSIPHHGTACGGAVHVRHRGHG